MTPVDPFTQPVINSLRADSQSDSAKRFLQAASHHFPYAWAVVNKEFFQTPSDGNSAHYFWWWSTGLPFAILLGKAGYEPEAQLRHVRLYASMIVPELGDGPRPDGGPKCWRSFMTDHHCPVEFSWAWGRGTELPVIRFAFEPIGMSAGSAVDPNNRLATQRFVAKYQHHVPACDLSWHSHFWDELVEFDNNPLPGAHEPHPGSHNSRAFLAIEFNNAGPMLKAYYMPEFKAATLACSAMSLIHSAINTLPTLPSDVRIGQEKLMGFLASNSQGQTLAPEIVATDCVKPETSRIKIYMRSQSTSLSSVIETLTMGDATVRSSLIVALEEFEKLWYLVFGLPRGYSAEAPLPTVDHRTGGMLYYFGLGERRSMPTVKVYLPVRHYGKGDLSVAAGLQNYLRSTSRTDFTSQYIGALEEMRRYSLQDGCQGLQTYLSCALEPRGLSITSYLSPIVYRCVSQG